MKKDKFVRKEMAFAPVTIKLLTTHSDGSATILITRTQDTQTMRIYPTDSAVIYRRINLTLEEQ